jgi:hypothetical protein
MHPDIPSGIPSGLPGLPGAIPRARSTHARRNAALHPSEDFKTGTMHTPQRAPMLDGRVPLLEPQGMRGVFDNGQRCIMPFAIAWPSHVSTLSTTPETAHP